ncbi:hypothetical protein N7532_010600 [Penicillium argentinense]|uniref:Zn(2)-C6 fungal-type domain-containing protein n=1 Tax=Penicillium argentinense TaxID=1131581 RepID=A0A9W9JXT4_9EURO|nr:uncharacterized protein N7532_010600 [Penicillium argentinense]KAJ5085829.1 hypothetical protein N7532_010600 [Penicillium argentinense]
MDTNHVPSGTPAPYGRACLNCTRAKSKCILLSNGNGCERCQRLKKDCRPSPSVRKRNGRSSASRTAQLEAKLDNIVSLLQANGGAPGLPADWENATTINTARPNILPCQATNLNSTPPGIPSPVPSAPGDSPLVEFWKSLRISPEEAEKTIRNFRTNNMRYIPFIHIPPNVTSQQLRTEKPFVWMCIMAVLTPGIDQRDILFSRITDIIHQKILVDVAPSMDLLLGLMIFVSWTTYTRRPFLNFYSHMVMGLVCDLGINQAVPKELSTMQAFKCAVGWKQHVSTSRTIEERRAVLGCFLLTSCVALTMFRVDALRWTPHMEESLTILMEAKECPDDELLVTLVKIQLVMDKVYHLRRDGDNQAPSLMYTKSIQAQLESVKNQTPPHLKEDRSVLLHYYTAEIIIHEAALRDTPSVTSPELHRLESLCACLQAAKSWFDTWLPIPGELYLGIPFTMYFQFSRALVTLYKLSTLDDPAWDRNMVRNTANILEILDRIAYNMKICASSFDVSAPEWNIFDKGMKMTQSIKQGWEPQLMEIWYPNVPPSGIESDFVTPSSTMPDFPINGFDDAWMMEVFGSM